MGGVISTPPRKYEMSDAIVGTTTAICASPDLPASAPPYVDVELHALNDARHRTTDIMLRRAFMDRPLD